MHMYQIDAKPAHAQALQGPIQGLELAAHVKDPLVVDRNRAQLLGLCDKLLDL
jgi:hypothetical protein